MTCVTWGIIVALSVLVPTISVEAMAGSPHMTLGENALAPLAFIDFCLRKPDRCAPSEEIRRIAFDDVNRRQIESVNSAVNRSIAPSTLPMKPNMLWQDDATTGRCDAYALAKRSQLLDLKQPSSALLLAVAVIPSGEAHIVVIVVTDHGDFVLDNLQQNIVRWDRLPYQWVKRSSPKNPQFWQTIVSSNAPQSRQKNDERSVILGEDNPRLFAGGDGLPVPRPNMRQEEFGGIRYGR